LIVITKHNKICVCYIFTPVSGKLLSVFLVIKTSCEFRYYLKNNFDNKKPQNVY